VLRERLRASLPLHYALRSRRDEPLKMHRVRDPSAPGLLRRFAAICYDSLVLAALAMLVTAALLFFTGGAAISAGNPAFRILLVVVAVLYFVWFWMHGRQTLGMRAWRLRVERFDGGALGWSDALARAATATLSWAACGLGFLWALVEPQRLAWHDRLSRTRLLRTPRSAHAYEPDQHDDGEQREGHRAHEYRRQLEDGAARGERAGSDEIDDADEHPDHQPLAGAGAPQRPEDER
jgi:uncharacterized RDD family membrane protein YckC